MSEELQFDVFRSHNHADKAVVRPPAKRLRKDGVKVWFDEPEMPKEEVPAHPSSFKLHPLPAGRRFIPLLLGDFALPDTLRRCKVADFREESEAAFAEDPATRGVIPPYYTAPEIMNDTRDLFVQLETLELSYYMKTRMENNPLWQNITHVFQRKIRARDVVRTLEERGETVPRQREDGIDDNTRAIENILSREFPEQTIPVKASI